jgi:hypothetical protein
MQDKTYNGWANYETWNVALWIDNSGDQQYFSERASDIYEGSEANSYSTREQAATNEMADELKDHFENASCDLLESAGQSASVWADLLGAALSEVDWHEIAQHFIDEVDKDEEAAA